MHVHDAECIALQVVRWREYQPAVQPGDQQDSSRPGEPRQQPTRDAIGMRR